MNFLVRLISKAKVDPTDVMNQQTISDLAKPIATLLKDIFL